MALLIENGADVNSRNYCGQVRDLGISVSFGYFLSILLVVPLDWIIDTVIFPRSAWLLFGSCNL